MYFAMKVAVARIGGQSACARLLGLPMPTVAAWVTPTRRTRPDDDTLRQIAQASGVAYECLTEYYARLERYRDKEFFRRKAPT